MKKFLVLLLCTIAFLNIKGQNNYISNQVLVMIESNTNIEQVITDVQISHQISLTHRRTISARGNMYLIEFDSLNHSVLQILSVLKSDDRVLISQPNHTDITLRNTTPNDLEYPIQWSLNNSASARIFAPQAWDISTDGITANGDTIVMAVVDGGVDITHIDLHLFKNKHEIPNNGIDDDNNGYIDDYDGWNAYLQSGNITSDPHGTHVSGIIGANTNNAEGIAGIVWGGAILPINASSNIESVVLEGYGYILEMRAKYNESNGDSGAFVVASNSSFGVDFASPVNYPLWCAFYDILGEEGVLSMAATANNSVDVDVVGDIPTTCPSTYLISVSNINSSGTLLGGYGAIHIDLAAPGTNIRSTIPGHNYGFKTGTSMATPHVTGVIGSMYSALCSVDINAVHQNPDSMALWIKDHLLNAVDTVSNLVGKNNTSGKLNMFTALQNVRKNNCMVYQNQLIMDSCGLCEASIEYNIAGDYPPYTILFSDTTYQDGDTLFYNLCRNIYTAIITDSTGYSFYDTITITGKDSLSVSHVITPSSDNISPDGTITITVSGGSFPYNYIWDNGNTTHENSMIVNGTYTVTITDSFGCTITDSFYLNTVGISTIVRKEFSISPNPNSGDFQINLPQNITDFQIIIYDGLGKVVYQKHYTHLQSLIPIQTNLENGIYFIKINGFSTQKIIIQK